MTTNSVSHLVFDVESIADGELISRVRYPDQNLDPQQAIETLCAERLEQYGSEFIPYTYHIPVSIAVIKVDTEYRIVDIVTLDAPRYRPQIITRHFWEGWRAYGKPTLVSFNGRTFDIPLLELSAFRYGIGIPEWFNLGDKSYEQKRNRYNQQSHFDLQEIITNYGSTRLSGGLNLVANLIGKPGKMGIAGHMVQELYQQGELQRINDYCRCDVLDTYFVLLRLKVLTGHLTLEQEQSLISDSCQWLEQRAEEHPVYAEYLRQCRPWENPWLESSEAPESAQEENPATSVSDGNPGE